ncbi:hypothetical protein WJX74_010945 [Apatococcus lobatus]|uniref:BTB domain-containing protein n=1 Tax=Apatococcus lobatus TaxID=904363 RepID=A0AAW1S7X9_9CHLO
MSVRLTTRASQQEDLVKKGVGLMLDSILHDLQAQDAERQMRALTALKDLTRSHRATHGMSAEAVQVAYREAGGFPLLLQLIDGCMTPREVESRQPDLSIPAAAVDALSTLARNNAGNRRAAIEAGAVHALCNTLGSSHQRPLSLDVLKALYNLIVPDETGYSTTEMFAAGGVHALIRLLRSCLEEMAEEERAPWLRELTALLFHLVRRSQLVVRLLTSEIGTLAALLTTSTDPLTLSLGMDIIEEMLSSPEGKKLGKLMAQEGALAALVRCMHLLQGLGSKVVLVLSSLAADPTILRVLRAILQPRDLACLCHAAALAATAADLDGMAAQQLAEALLRTEDAAVLKGLVLARCVGRCLTLPAVAPTLISKATSPTGIALMENLPNDSACEVGMAAACLLPHNDACASVLAHLPRLQALIQAVLNEALANPPGRLGGEATKALAHALYCLPDNVSPEADEVSAFGSTRPSSGESSGVPSRDDGTSTAATAGSDKPNGATPAHAAAPIMEGGPMPTTASTQSSQSIPNGDAGPGPGSYQTVTFHVGGHEFLALAWVLEQSSRAIAHTLRQIPNPSAAAVVVPDIEGLPSERMYEMFALAVEFAYHGHVELADADVLDLWAVAASLQMPAIQALCEDRAAGLLKTQPTRLQDALHFSSIMRSSGLRLRAKCVQHVLDNFEQLVASGVLRSLAKAHRDALAAGLVNQVGERLYSVMQRHEDRAAAEPRSPRLRPPEDTPSNAAPDLLPPDGGSGPADLNARSPASHHMCASPFASHSDDASPSLSEAQQQQQQPRNSSSEALHHSSLSFSEWGHTNGHRQAGLESAAASATVGAMKQQPLAEAAAKGTQKVAAADAGLPAAQDRFHEIQPAPKS